MICLSCQQTITDNLDSCPHCHAQLNAEKLRFIKYLGDVDSLVGYQKSYKLVLLKNIFEFIRSKLPLSVDSIMYKIKEFYLKRVHNGLSADYDVDDRIKNISKNTSIYDIWAVFKANPYNVINNQGFLFLEKNNRGELIFVLPNEIISSFTSIEYDNLIALLNKKLTLYYSRYDNYLEIKQEEVKIPLQAQEDNYVTEISQQSTPKEELIPIEQTSLSNRAKRGLLRGGYKNLQDILSLDDDSLYRIRNIGYNTVLEIKEHIANYRTSEVAYRDNIQSESHQLIDATDVSCLLKNTNLSVRAKNVLDQAGYKSVGDILEITEEELYSYRNLGRLTVEEILDFVQNIRKTNGISVAIYNAEGGILQQPLRYTTLGTRAQNALAQAGYEVVEDIIELTEPELWDLPSVGEGTVEEILKYLISVRLQLAEESNNGDQESFELIKYPYILISPECEQIPVAVLSYFGMSPSLLRKLQNQCVYRLGQLKQMDYLQIHTTMGDEWSKLLHFTLNEFYNGAVVAVKLFLDKISEKEDLSFIVERSRGATLQELGNSRGLTRERARQTIEKSLKLIKPMAVCLARTLIRNNQVKYLTIQDIYDVYDNDDYDAILSFALIESEEIEYLESIGIFLIKEDFSYSDILNEAIKEYVGEGVFWSRNLDQLSEILQSKNLYFFELSDVWLYMVAHGYKVYGDYVTPRAVSYGTLLAIIVDEEFPQGISFSDSNDASKLRQRAFERFGDINLPTDNRPLEARVSGFLVLCDRNRFISPNRVTVDISTLDIIRTYIDTSENNIIYYQALFNQFVGLLTMTSDITNYHYLHGVLKYYFGGEYTFTRDYLQKEQGNISGKLANSIYEFIVNKKRAVSRNELKDYLKISSDAMITNVIIASNKIFQWEFNYYNCLGNIELSLTETEFLTEIIEESFSTYKNYCSAKLLYDYCQKIMPEMLDRNSIKNPTSLFYVTSSILGDKYKYRNPHILPTNSSLSTTEEIAKNYLEMTNIINRETFFAMSDKLGWGYSTATSIFDSLTENLYFRISRNTYLKKELLQLNEVQLFQIREVLSNSLKEREFIGNWEINLNKLPNLGFEWTLYLFETVVKNFINEFKIISPNFGIHKTERGLCLYSCSKLTTFDEIVAYVVKKSGKTLLTDSDMYTTLVLAGVVKNSVPNEIRESKFFEYKNGIYKMVGM